MYKTLLEVSFITNSHGTLETVRDQLKFADIATRTIRVKVRATIKPICTKCEINRLCFYVHDGPVKSEICVHVKLNIH